VRARILGPALPPVNLEYVPRCAAVVSRSPPRKYFLFRSSEPKNAFPSVPTSVRHLDFA